METVNRSKRVTRGLSYLTLLVAGISLTVSPTQTVTTTLGAVVYAWTVLLALGSLASLLGSITGRWLGEFVGLPATATTMLVYSLIIMFGGEFSLVKFAFGLIMLSFGLKMAARWDDIRCIAAASKRAGPIRREEEGA